MKKLTIFLLLLIVFAIAGCEVDETSGNNDETPNTIKETYTVTFEILGNALHELVVEEGDTIESISPSLEDGQTFDNWYSDVDLTNLFDFTTFINEDTTIYGLITIDTAVADFDTIKDYLFDNGEYSYINEPGREVEYYKMNVQTDGMTLHLVLEILTAEPSNIENITTTLILPQQSGFVGLYVGMSGSKQEYEDGIMHVFNGGTDEGTMKWYGLDCENYEISDASSRTCTTFQNEATINNYFFTLKSDNLHLVIEKADKYFEEILGVTLH